MVEASSVPVAVFPEEARTDLRCCVFGKLYLKKVLVLFCASIRNGRTAFAAEFSLSWSVAMA